MSSQFIAAKNTGVALAITFLHNKKTHGKKTEKRGICG
jgi:hypothetical protein